MKTIVAIPDFTRKAHLKKILPSILKKLESENISYRDIEIIIATGLHRPPTKKEIKNNLGNISNKIKVSTHNYRKNYVTYFGKTRQNVPIYLNKKLKKAETIITVGVVEPHLYAGYSGGAKVVAIGLAGEKTINLTHHPKFLDHPKTKPGSITGNPFSAFIDEVGSILPIRYSINIINDKNGNLLRIFDGERQGSFRDAVNYVKKISEKKVTRSFDVLICNIPQSKAINIYQASRAFNYVVQTENNILKTDPIILVKARLEEGFGKGLGEERFMDKMLKMKDPKKLIIDIKKGGCVAGEHRAYMVAKAMLEARLGFISEKASLYRNKTPFLFFKDLKEAKKFINSHYKNPQIYHLANAFNPQAYP